MDAEPKRESELGGRWGSGEARITDVTLLDASGHELKYLTTFRDTVIRIRVNSHLPIEDSVVGVRITHLNGQNVWGTNTRRRAVTIPIVNGNATIDLAIPQMPLLEGTYELTVALTDNSELHTYDHWEKRIRFDVHQHDTFDEGLVTVASTWSISTKSD
jgi:hypothetical protein